MLVLNVAWCCLSGVKSLQQAVRALLLRRRYRMALKRHVAIGVVYENNGAR